MTAVATNEAAAELEGLRGDSRARWVRAALPDSPARGLIPAGEAYVTVEVIDFGVRQGGFGKSGSKSVFMSHLAFAHPPRKLHQEQVLDRVNGPDDPRGDLAILCRQVPYHGKWEGLFRVDAIRSEATLKALLRLRDAVLRGASTPADGAEDMPPSEEGDVDDMHESLLDALGLARLAEMVAKASIGLATQHGGKLVSEIADMIAEQDGRRTTRLAFRAEQLPAETGDYVLCNLPAEQTGDHLKFDPNDRTLRAERKVLRNIDFAIVRVTTSARHENIDLIPGLGEDYRALMEVLVSAGDVTGAWRQFQRRVRFSEHLIDTDREAMIATVRSKVDSVKSDLETADRNGELESVLVRPVTRLTIRSLKDLWTQGVRRDTTNPLSDAKTIDSGDAPPVPSRKPVAMPTAGKRFDIALAFALQWEGGFSDHRKDRGGPTNKGVTQKVYTAWREGRGEPEQSVEFITEAEMHAIYITNYWQLARCERFRPNVDWVMFDIAVNSGPGGAATILQRALNAINSQSAQITVDGKIGPRTLAAAEAIDPVRLGQEMIRQRLALFDRIVARDPDQLVFLKGWRNRAHDLARAAGLSERGTLESMDRAPAIPEDTAYAEYID
jgi:lysozyme family protein